MPITASIGAERLALDEKTICVKFAAPNRPQGSGPVPNRFKAIPVVDAHGDQLTLYEIRERGSLFGLVPKKRFELCTGEVVEEHGNGYVVVRTGEKLICVEGDND